MQTKTLDEKFTQTELGALQKEMAKMEQAAAIKESRIHQLEESVSMLQENLEKMVSQALRLNPTLMQVETILHRKRSNGGKQPAL